MCAAGASLRSGNSKSPRDRGSTGTPCHFIRAQQRECADSIARGKPQGGRVKTHGCVRPANLRAFCRGARWEGTGLISRKRAGSIPAPATNFHGPLDHSGGHSPRKRESTVQSRGGPLFSNRGKVENPGSLISFLIVVRLHVPQPNSRGGSSLKTRAGL